MIPDEFWIHCTVAIKPEARRRIYRTNVDTFVLEAGISWLHNARWIQELARQSTRDASDVMQKMKADSLADLVTMAARLRLAHARKA